MERGPYIPPSAIRVSIWATMTGFGVGVSVGPSHNDPLGQRESSEHFATLDAALSGVPKLVRGFINDRADEAERMRTAAE